MGLAALLLGGHDPLLLRDGLVGLLVTPPAHPATVEGLEGGLTAVDAASTCSRATGRTPVARSGLSSR
jgi:hypothetical protein